MAQCGGLRGYVPQLSAGKQYAPTIDVYVIQVRPALDPERAVYGWFYTHSSRVVLLARH